MPVVHLAKYSAKILYPLYEKTSLHRSVIEEVVDVNLRDAYQHCRFVTKTHAKTFYLATRFLPNKKQRGVFSVYALCRYIDDLVDECEDLLSNKSLTTSQIKDRIEDWRFKLESVFNGYGNYNHPVLQAVKDTLQNYKLDLKYPLLLLDGVTADLHKNRYQNFNELYDYCFKVASVVGLMTAPIFGFENPKAPIYAEKLGIAMQLTNILRDISADADKGRIYLPLNELQQFGLTEDDILNKCYDQRFIDFMKYQVKRAKEYYNEAFIGIPMLEKDSQLPVYLAAINYSAILDKVIEMNYDIWNKRAYLSSSEKLKSIPSAWWATYFHD